MTLEITQSVQIGVSLIEDGYSWCYVDDEAWARAEMRDYLGGIPILTRRP